MPADTVHVGVCARGIECLDTRHTGRMALFAMQVDDQPPRHYCADDIDDRVGYHHAQGSAITYTPAARALLIREGMRVIA